MNSQTHTDNQRIIIIAGAGPVGLFTALSLARRGIPVLVLEMENELTEDRRAGGFHPPTVDMFEDIGLLPELKDIGYELPVYQFQDRMTGLIANLDLRILKNDVRNPYMLCCLQHQLCAAIYKLAREEDLVDIRFGHKVVSLTQTSDLVEAGVETTEGTETFQAPWLIAADGGRSRVRRQLGLDFPGYTWPQKFLLMETFFDFTQYIGNLAYIADAEEWRLVFKLPMARDRYFTRVVCGVDANAPDAEVLADDYVQERLQRTHPKDTPYEMYATRTYAVHQRVASTFRKGRVLLAGDAAHINNPIGGYGLNGGLHDAVNLVDKLARVWQGEADESLLDRYVRQRRETNIRFIQEASIENKKRMDEKDPVKRKEDSDRIAALEDNEQARHQFLLKFAMIDGLRFADTID